MKSNWPLWLFAIVALTACAADGRQDGGQSTRQSVKPAAATGLDKIQNIVVIYAENRSFDHLFGSFPGADGIAQATAEQKTQLDFDGKPLPRLPAVYSGGKPDSRFPTAGLPNGPFRIDAPPINGRLDQVLLSPWHLYYQNREQINGGANNKFVAASNVGAWVMGYFDGSKMKMWQWAREYTLADHFFMGAFGGSFLNHQWLICACAPTDPNVPEADRPRLDSQGKLERKPASPPSVLAGPPQMFDGRVTPDGYLVNTSQPPYQPSGVPPADKPDYADPAGHPAPPQTAKTIGDTLTARSITWAWYAGGWDQALADGRQDAKVKRKVIYNAGADSPNFQPHHQPFNYFARFAPGSVDRAVHLKDEQEFLAAIDGGKLPQVAFFKPAGRYTEHPSYTDVLSGDEHLDMILTHLKNSPQWPHIAVIVTYDENGGFWDHVPPPSGSGWGDRWGPGSRIPAIIVSPYAKHGYVDKTSYDTTSILKLIARRFSLEALPGVRANAGDLTPAFDFAQ
jgi:acid phosphatase